MSETKTTTADLMKQFAILAQKVKDDEDELAVLRARKEKKNLYIKNYFKTETGKKNNAAALKRWRAKKRIKKMDQKALDHMKQYNWHCPHCVEPITEMFIKEQDE